MDLKDFVSQALIQITEGVSEAQEIVQKKGGFVNPAIRQTEVGQTMHDGRVVQIVDFNIAVSVTEDSSCSGGGKLSVATVFKASAEKSSSEKNSTTSTISFKVPLALSIDRLSLDELLNKEKEDADREMEVLDACYTNANTSYDPFSAHK
ncbi:hypothetical protein [Photobacterium leiognathi]|uniref:hypothetical protein n=1 Tax=Photobacterium leiognathi TaxID=553611 RepID=UPI0029813FB8|nr:hypothetical protein [Photobacterium leiognathi]